MVSLAQMVEILIRIFEQTCQNKTLESVGALTVPTVKEMRSQFRPGLAYFHGIYISS